jgi:hypothetical protein
MQGPRLSPVGVSLATQPSELADDQDHEEGAWDTHEHPDAPQDICRRWTHVKGSCSCCGDEDCGHGTSSVLEPP